jgi:hypothetical protein
MVLLGLELLALCTWSYVLASRFSLTRDFSIYEQSAFQFAQGNFDPTSTVAYGTHVTFYEDHGFFLWAILSAVWRLWPNPAVLLWLQNLAVVGAQVIALNWLSEMTASYWRESGRVRLAAALTAAGIALLVLDPFVLWSESFDLHSEAFATFFLLGAAHDLVRGRRRAFLWVAAGLLTGQVGSTYLAALGLSLALYGRRWLLAGMATAAAGFAATALMTAFGATAGTQLSGIYGNALIGTGLRGVPNLGVGRFLAALAEHPVRPLQVLWHGRLNIWGTISPIGVVGVFWLPVLLPLVLVIVSSNLAANVFGFTGFQTLPVYVLGPVGTIAALICFARWLPRRRVAVWLAIATVVSNVVVWAVVWDPPAKQQWLRVSAGAASTLHNVLAKIRPQDEVMTDQGFIGPFSARKWIYSYVGLGYFTASSLPIHSRRLWLVVSARQGIELEPPVVTYSTVAGLASDPNFRLVAHRNGIWAFVSTRPLHIGSSLKLPVSDHTAEPAWALAGPAGRAVLAGPARDWYTSSNGRRGYVLDGAYWREPHGMYQATVRLAVAGEAFVEVWDTTTHTLLARQEIADTIGRETVDLTTSVPRSTTHQTFRGWGLWSRSPVEPRGDQIEVRVWSPGGDSIATVYSVHLRSIAHPAASARARQ